MNFFNLNDNTTHNKINGRQNNLSRVSVVGHQCENSSNLTSERINLIGGIKRRPEKEDGQSERHQSCQFQVNQNPTQNCKHTNNMKNLNKEKITEVPK